MKKVFMLLMFAGATVMFVSCDNTSSEGTVVETDTVDVEKSYEVEKTTVEIDTTTDTETIEVEEQQQ